MKARKNYCIYFFCKYKSLIKRDSEKFQRNYCDTGPEVWLSWTCLRKQIFSLLLRLPCDLFENVQTILAALFLPMEINEALSFRLPIFMAFLASFFMHRLSSYNSGASKSEMDYSFLFEWHFRTPAIIWPHHSQRSRSTNTLQCPSWDNFDWRSGEPSDTKVWKKNATNSCAVYHWRMGFLWTDFKNDATCFHPKTRDWGTCQFHP